MKIASRLIASLFLVAGFAWADESGSHLDNSQATQWYWTDTAIPANSGIRLTDWKLYNESGKLIALPYTSVTPKAEPTKIHDWYQMERKFNDLDAKVRGLELKVREQAAKLHALERTVRDGFGE